MIWDELKDEDWAKAAPYVDTLLVPVVGVNLDDKEGFARQSRDSVTAAVEIERQLHGRTMLMPPVAYIVNDDWLQPFVLSIRERTQQASFSHLFFLIEERWLEHTRDVDWGDWIQVPELPQSEEKLRGEIRKLCEQLIQRWQE